MLIFLFLENIGSLLFYSDLLSFFSCVGLLHLSRKGEEKERKEGRKEKGREEEERERASSYR